MIKKIRKAVFPVGGLGTRFLPATKAMPKEMLPVVDKPLIQYAVEEAREAGIEHFIFVTGHGKTAIEDHFDANPNLEKLLMNDGKWQLLEFLRNSTLESGKISYTRQSEPKGLGHAVWCARDLIGDEPFAVLLPDDIFHCKTACLKQLVDAYNEVGGNVVAINDVPLEQTNRYGVLSVEKDDGRLIKANGMVEKPDPSAAPSTCAISGRYVLSPEVLKELDNQKAGVKGEIQLTDAMAATLDRVPFHGVRFEGRRFDCGNKIGFLMANIEYALDRDDLKDEFKASLQEFIKTL
ncbi:MAG: UTP--glucose-1-phosphate uridylyltransferase GalU [Alphaproteobacteria bacterium]|nr:UTP--glucose-1-phosphate uridylyltransferase GalU [Alphaproteobacteria bacterium]